MALYLLLVLLAYYILKPVSRAMFLNKFDIDELPYLYIVIAGAGGVMAYFYTKLAIHSSLKTAVTCLHLRHDRRAGSDLASSDVQLAMDAVFFNAFVSLFSITLVSQGWLVAANVFSTREAKRLYGILGVSAVIGAAFGGSFTSLMVHYIGSRNLLLASAGFVLLAYFAFSVLSRRRAYHYREAKGAEQGRELLPEGADGVPSRGIDICK